jgi:hypothetical protein
MVISAMLNGTSSVLQRRASKTEPSSAAFTLRMFLDLARQPTWALGIVAMITGFVVHGISISISRIALVQPLLVAELPFTMLLAALVFKTNIHGHEWWSIGLQTVGLATFVACLSPVGGDPNAVPPTTWALACGVTVAGVVILTILGYLGRGVHRAAWLGVATGGAFGLNSSLIAGIGASVANGGNLFTTWQTYGVVVVGPSSFFLLQNALESGNLVASQPGFTLTNPLVSVAFGLAVFNEQGRTGLFLIGIVAGAVMIVGGTILLSRSDLLNPGGTKQRQRPG